MEFWKILLDDIKEPVSYLPMGVGAAIMMLLLLRLVAGEKAWKRPQVYYYFLLGVYETVVWIQAFFRGSRVPERGLTGSCLIHGAEPGSPGHIWLRM